jgi:hypothetical protein
MQEKNVVTDFVLEKKCVEKYLDVEKLGRVTQHDLQDFQLKNTEDDSSGSVGFVIPNFVAILFIKRKAHKS